MESIPFDEVDAESLEAAAVAGDSALLLSRLRRNLAQQIDLTEDHEVGPRDLAALSRELRAIDAQLREMGETGAHATTTPEGIPTLADARERARRRGRPA